MPGKTMRALSMAAMASFSILSESAGGGWFSIFISRAAWSTEAASAAASATPRLRLATRQRTNGGRAISRSAPIVTRGSAFILARRHSSGATLGSGHPDQDPDSDGQRQHGQRAVFDLVDHASQGVITDLGAEAGRIAAEPQCLVARNSPAAAKPLHDLAHCRCDRVS